MYSITLLLLGVALSLVGFQSSFHKAMKWSDFYPKHLSGLVNLYWMHKSYNSFGWWEAICWANTYSSMLIFPSGFIGEDQVGSSKSSYYAFKGRINLWFRPRGIQMLKIDYVRKSKAIPIYDLGKNHFWPCSACHQIVFLTKITWLTRASVLYLLSKYLLRWRRHPH